MPRARTRKPQVGTAVYYHEPDSGEQRRAVVIHLHDPDDPRGRVALCIGHPHGVDLRPAVPFGAGKFGHWSWPAKTEPISDPRGPTALEGEAQPRDLPDGP